jgi:hypothetical protein
MTAKKGTLPFFSEDAKKAESNHRNMIHEIIKNEIRFNWYKSRSVAHLIGANKAKYSFLQNGKTSSIYPDGGFFYSKNDNELLGVAENKFQESSQNAIERLDKYLKINTFRLEPHRIFVSCYGEGFIQKSNKSMGTVGVWLDLAIATGITVLINPTEQDFKIGFKKWLDSLI